MEKTDTQAKQAALDNKSAYAGNVAPDPEMDVDPMGSRAGLDIQPEDPLSVAEDLRARDQDRYELDVDSKANKSERDRTDVEQIEITQTETGQYEAVKTQPVQSGQPEDLV
ncbi:MAG: DUF6335 family protein [Phormidesmis sp.]